jgi:hypothetical protein
MNDFILFLCKTELVRMWISEISNDLFNDPVIEKHIKTQLINKFKESILQRKATDKQKNKYPKTMCD